MAHHADAVAAAAPFDVAVAGGGPAGASAAIALARASRRVIILEPSPLRDKVGEMLPPSANPLLVQLGVGVDMEAAGHQPCHAIESLWGSSTLASSDFIRSAYGHGWHIDRARFETDLRSAAASAGACIATWTSLERARRSGDSWTLTLGSGSTIEARWLIEATGRPARLARRLGMAQRRLDRLVGFAATFVREDPAEVPAVTSVEAVDSGWWYTAPLGCGRRVVVFLTDSDLPAARLAATAAGFGGLLGRTQLVAFRLGNEGARLVAGPRAHVAASARLVEAGGDGWLAAGDALMAMDPLSGHGLVQALRSGQLAAAAIDRALAGDMAGLRHCSEDLESRWASFIQQRQMTYAAGRRWAADPFWSRRLAGPSI